MSKEKSPDASSASKEQTLCPVKSGDEEIYVTLPASEEADLEETSREAAYYLETLRANQRVAEEPDPLGPGQTHRIETDEAGRRVLRRKRFSAV